MNLNKISPLPDKILRDLWNNWLCENDNNKNSFYAYGLGSHWRERQIQVMRKLEIPEPIQFRRGGDSRAKLIKFSEKTKHLFAIEQNLIARTLHFKDNARASIYD